MVVCGLKVTQETMPPYSLPHPPLSSSLFSLSLSLSSSYLSQECQLLVLNSSAQVTSRAVLHPSVDQDGYIVKVCSEHVLLYKIKTHAFLLH